MKLQEGYVLEHFAIVCPHGYVPSTSASACGTSVDARVYVRVDMIVTQRVCMWTIASTNAKKTRTSNGFMRLKQWNEKKKWIHKHPPKFNSKMIMYFVTNSTCYFSYLLLLLVLRFEPLLATTNAKKNTVFVSCRYPHNFMKTKNKHVKIGLYFIDNISQMISNRTPCFLCVVHVFQGIELPAIEPF